MPRGERAAVSAVVQNETMGGFRVLQPPAFNLICSPFFARQVVSKSGFSASTNIRQGHGTKQAAGHKSDYRYFPVRPPTGNEKRGE